MDLINIAGREVGNGRPCFIIAEAGVNHCGSLDSALAMVDAAAGSGADAVKFQTFISEQLVLPSALKAEYQKVNSGSDQSQYEMLKQLELSREDHFAIMERCASRGIMFLSTPFSIECADMLSDMDLPAFKVGSGEITNFPMLKHLAGLGRPLLLSTGMSELSEVCSAVSLLRENGCSEILLFHCVSNYPAAVSDVNLRAMLTMAGELDLPVGYSDHTMGSASALAAVALGACAIEKHFTLDRNLEGPDHKASIEPEGLAELVKQIRDVELSLGSGEKIPVASEMDVKNAARRSLVASQDIAAGSELIEDDICLKRPGTGLSPVDIDKVVGKRAIENIPAGTLLEWGMVQ